jgi:hypothetical protein
MSTDNVIARLKEAKQNLTTAKSKGLQAATIVARARAAVGQALGRNGGRLLAEISAKEKAVVAQVMGIDALIKSVDEAIAQARAVGEAVAAAGGSGGDAGGGGPA